MVRSRHQYHHYKTTIQTWKYVAPAILVPFMFTLDKSGTSLLLMGSIAALAKADWLHLNMDTYRGKSVEIGIQKALDDRFPPDRDAAQADGFVADIKACATTDAMTVYARNGALRTVMARWKAERPDLWGKISAATDARWIELGGAPS